MKRKPIWLSFDIAVVTVATWKRAIVFSLCCLMLVILGTANAERPSGIDWSGFDKSVAPQDDFFQYVNGTWLEKTEIPPDKSDYGIFTYLTDQSRQALRKIVEELANKPDRPAGSDEQKVGDFYRSAMDLQKRAERGMAAMRAELERVDEVASLEDLVRFLSENQRRGISTPLGVFVAPDARRSSHYAAYVSQSGLTLPDRDYYLLDDARFQRIREAFRSYVVRLCQAVGLQHPDRIARHVLELETALAHHQWDRVTNRDPVRTYNKLPAAELQAMWKNVSWEEFARGAGVHEQESLIVRQPDYFKALDGLLKDFSLDVWQDYLRFQIADAYAPASSEELEQLHFEFHSRTLRGVAEPPPRWKRALEMMDGVIGELVGKIYVREYFRPEAKEAMLELVENLRRAFAHRIRQLDWMSEATKQQALQKLAKVRVKVGYPDKWKDYSALEIRPDDYAGNLQRAAAFEYQRMLDKLGKPVDRDEWHMNPQTVNAYYNPLMNEIVFPAAILQPPFFQLDADSAVNYGAIGAVIGHELSHGFDDKGSKYDGDGNLRNWWTEEDRQAFEERGKKLVEQFNQYRPFEDMAINGELTLGENIGDLGGVNIAFTAYQLSLEGRPSPVIEGTTGEQRFFMGYAQVWRRKYREEELRRRLLTDPHSPARYRVIGIVSNIDAFYDAFGVQPQHKMYIAPEKRVRIW
ncbi:MAG: zinc metalloprotease [Pirellulaceae bacterium]|nr:MAG: zinc metalloprotease [Pirellulaceae bacterium]